MTKPRTTNIADVSIWGGYITNNIYECLDGEFQNRMASVRGFQSENPALLGMMIIQHNFVSSHRRLK